MNAMAQTLEQNPRRIWRIVGGEALILDTESGNYYSVNPVGTAILKGVTAGLAPGVIATQVTQTFRGAAPEVVADQIAAFSSVLHEEGLHLLRQDCADDEVLDDLEYTPPVMQKYDQLHQVVAYSPD